MWMESTQDMNINATYAMAECLIGINKEIEDLMKRADKDLKELKHVLQSDSVRGSMQIRNTMMSGKGEGYKDGQTSNQYWFHNHTGTSLVVSRDGGNDEFNQQKLNL